MEIALILGWAFTSLSLEAVILWQGKRDRQERRELLDRIQAPQAIQDRVSYEEMLKLPTPPAPTFNDDIEFHEVKSAETR